jgi:DNA-binding beta-propeller fold protein YncE
VQKTVEIPLADSGGQHLSSPSRSLDARYLHVANEATGEVYSLNAFSRVIYRTFTVGPSPARPYTTPQGAFLYLFDDSGRFVVVEQETFREYAAQNFSQAIELVVVGRFDRFNLLLGTRHRAYYVYDNVDNKVVAQGLFEDRPVAALGAADGKTAYVAFANIPRLAMFDLENQAVRYFTATEHGAGAFAMGLSNTVCH